MAGDRRHRQLITALWVFGLSLLVIMLIYWEQSAILYILATFGVTALLVVVATADLAHTDVTAGQVSQSDDASGVATRISSTYRNIPSK